MKKKLIHVLISILMFCVFSGMASANVVTPGWWSTGYHVGYCIYNNNVIPSLPFLELEIGRSATGASQYTTCDHGKWIARNAYDYKATMICTTVGVNGQRGTFVTKIIFHKENNRKFSISINSLLIGKYKTTYNFAKNKCPVIKHPLGAVEIYPGVPIPRLVHNKLLKQFSGG